MLLEAHFERTKSRKGVVKKRAEKASYAYF
jgi:hypothetical protein